MAINRVGKLFRLALVLGVIYCIYKYGIPFRWMWNWIKYIISSGFFISLCNAVAGIGLFIILLVFFSFENIPMNKEINHAMKYYLGEKYIVYSEYRLNGQFSKLPLTLHDEIYLTNKTYKNITSIYLKMMLNFLLISLLYRLSHILPFLIHRAPYLLSISFLSFILIEEIILTALLNCRQVTEEEKLKYKKPQEEEEEGITVNPVEENTQVIRDEYEHLKSRKCSKRLLIRHLKLPNESITGTVHGDIIVDSQEYNRHSMSRRPFKDLLILMILYGFMFIYHIVGSTGSYLIEKFIF